MIIKMDIISIIFKNEIIDINNNNNNNVITSLNNPLLIEKENNNLSMSTDSDIISNGIRLTDHKLNEIKWDIESTTLQ